MYRGGILTAEPGYGTVALSTAFYPPTCHCAGRYAGLVLTNGWSQCHAYQEHLWLTLLIGLNHPLISKVLFVGYLPRRLKYRRSEFLVSSVFLETITSVWIGWMIWSFFVGYYGNSGTYTLHLFCILNRLCGPTSTLDIGYYIYYVNQ